MPTNSRRIASARSSCRTTRSSPRNSKTSSASTSILPPMRSSSRSTRRAKSRRSTAPAGFAAEAGPCRDDDARLQTSRHHHAVRSLNILDGTVIGRNLQRHRHQEFIRFLNTIEEQVPLGKVIHAIVDNYATHKHPKVRQWLARHPRWTFHFTPTSASWLNAVEGFFSKLTRRRLKRGVFRSVVDLQVAINRFVAETNADPKPFVWTADPKRVLAAVKRGKQTLESLH